MEVVNSEENQRKYQVFLVKILSPLQWSLAESNCTIITKNNKSSLTAKEIIIQSNGKIFFKNSKIITINRTIYKNILKKFTTDVQNIRYNNGRKKSSEVKSNKNNIHILRKLGPER